VQKRPNLALIDTKRITA
jgi:hypothetical protein